MSRSLIDLATLAGAFLAATAAAGLLGAPNLGTAATAGQVAFVAALLALMVRRA